jgi:hypothetical protein
MAEPLTKDKFYEQHSAYFQQIGFDVQFAGGIYYLISLGDTDTLEYETKDDFVVYRAENGEKITEYYQVKHTKSVGANMTDGDDDFWKSVDNWIEAYKLHTLDEKKTYFTKARFIVLTNKQPANYLNAMAKQLQDGEIQLDAIKTELNNRIKTDPGYKPIAEKLLTLGDNPMLQFLMKLRIQYFEDFIKDMYAHFVQTHFNASRSDQIVRNLVGDLWTYKQKCAGKFSFTGSEFRQRFKPILEQVSLNDDYLVMDGYDDQPVIPDNFADLMMVKQLAMVDAIDIPPSTEDIYLMEYLTTFYQFQNAMQGFEKIQLVTPERKKKIDKVAFNKYHSLFKTHQDKLIQRDRSGKALDEEEQKEAGRNTLNAVMDTTLNVTRLTIDKGFSNGWFLSMSNEVSPRVAWHYSLYKQYIKKK